MMRVIIVLVLLGLILLGVSWAFRWLVQNRVRIRMHRSPTGREIIWISMALQVLRSLLRLLLRR
ncbi:MAG: hypothetical protein L0Y56_08930 [Nitrospira sp.]|nr:hypothetical protein [Nitrospira sp.]